MAALIDSFVGHSAQREWLIEQSRREQLPSAIIFHGPNGVGKRTLALALLQTLNCEKSQLACGHCSNCVRALDEKNELVYNLVPESKKTITVDQVRELQSFFNLKSLHRARFVIIDPADKLSKAAANALLKVLEDTPEKTHFILITEQMRSLLATIRSRAHILKFSSLNETELLQYGAFEPVALAWSDGRLHRAIELQDRQRVEQLNECLHFLFSLTCEDGQDWKKKAPWFFNDDDQREFCFLIWKQALAKRLYGQGENLDWLPEATGAVSQLYDSIEDMKSNITANVDKLLAVENFYYQVRQEITQ